MPESALHPDLVPSEFFLFGFLKQKMQGVHFPDRESFKSPISQTFGEIDRDLLVPVFLAWTGRLE
jgi:hypothetical protein